MTGLQMLQQILCPTKRKIGAYWGPDARYRISMLAAWRASDLTLLEATTY